MKFLFVPGVNELKYQSFHTEMVHSRDSDVW